MLSVDGKRGIPLLVVDVQIKDVRWDFLVSERAGNFADAGLGIVAVATLLIAKRPERRQRCAADERGVFLDDLLRIRAGEKIIVELAALRAERKIVRRFLAKIEAAAIGVVEEHAIGGAFVQAHEKTDCLVHRTAALAPTTTLPIPPL